MGKLEKQPHGGALYRPDKGEAPVNPGRPRKIINSVITELENNGYKNLKKSQVTQVYELLLTLPQEELVKLAKDEDVPMMLRIICKSLLSNKGFEIIERLLDRTYGKPNNQVDITSDGNPINVIIDSSYARKPNFRIDNDPSEANEVAEESS